MEIFSGRKLTATNLLDLISQNIKENRNLLRSNKSGSQGSSRTNSLSRIPDVLYNLLIFAGMGQRIIELPCLSFYNLYV
jgi:hypothetical protein